MTVITRPLEFTEVYSISASSASIPYLGVAATTATNGAPAPGFNLGTSRSRVSVDSTVQFIRAHYDSLFRRLADYTPRG